jgi:hypothetical protein|uniref:Uncharacterized protein n=1 Tax=viral metagenome TaxID=1070528 RepID=A0A6C0DKM7_9ZZZZ
MNTTINQYRTNHFTKQFPKQFPNQIYKKDDNKNLFHFNNQYVYKDQYKNLQVESICIPRVDISISKDFIYNTLSELRIGKIHKIIEIPLRNEFSYKRIIIKIQWNNNEPITHNIKKHLYETGSFKIVYDMPWYWKIVLTYEK